MGRSRYRKRQYFFVRPKVLNAWPGHTLMNASNVSQLSFINTMKMTPNINYNHETWLIQ